ncbi:arylsulfatase B-like [Panulirus ornatus]|uniref:arylsulfatase B-like n=1 Tax=Panulirus ornatus TaxID=150431 RepID=UPI003A86AD4F
MRPGRRPGGCWFLLMLVTFASKLTAASSTPAPTPSPTTTAPPPTTRPPHIIIMVADDLGWNDVSWHNSQVVTPHLEALARSGVLLEQSYVQPICTPTRSALLAGRYPFTIGRQHGVLRPCEPTGLDLNLTLLPQSLKAAGYSTHAVGKWHLGFCDWAYTPTKRGFDTFYGYYNGAEDYYSHERSDLFDPRMDQCYEPETEHCSRTPQTPGDGGREWLDLRNNTVPDHSKKGVYSTYVFASYVEDLLSSRSSEEPMFLYLAFQSVHAPLQVPAKYTKPYKHIHHHDRRTYLGMVGAMDEAVGRVVAALKASGHYNNSVIVFTTDNGGPTGHGANNWPLRGHKTTLWEGGTRGSAFIHSPLLPNPGTVSHQLMHVTDWYRTLVGVAGGVVPRDTGGMDQWAAVTGAAPSPRTHMVYNVDNTTAFKAGVRLGDYKLLVGDPGNGDWTPPPELTQATPQVPSSSSSSSTTNTTSSSHPLHALPSSTPDATERPAMTSADLRISNAIRGHLLPAGVSRLHNDASDHGRTTDSERTTLPSTPDQPQPLQLPREKSAAKQYIQNMIFTRRKHRGLFTFSFDDAPDTKPGDVGARGFDLGKRHENDIRQFHDLVSSATPSSSAGVRQSTSTDETSSPSDVNTSDTFDVATLNTTDVSAAGNTPDNSSSTFDVDSANTPAPGKEQEDGEWVSWPGAELEGDVRHLLQLLTKKNDSKIRLYNLKDDPEERVNLAATRMEVVVEGLQFLLQQVSHYVPADNKPQVPDRAKPSRWHDVWSPGWC